MDFILNRLSPEGQEWLVIDKETGDVVYRFLDGSEGMGKPVPLHQCQGYLQFSPEVMAYWTINPFARHYPILGLFVGFLLSTLLAWKLLRHAPRATKVPSTI